MTTDKLGMKKNQSLTKSLYMHSSIRSKKLTHTCPTCSIYFAFVFLGTLLFAISPRPSLATHEAHPYPECKRLIEGVRVRSEVAKKQWIHYFVTNNGTKDIELPGRYEQDGKFTSTPVAVHVFYRSEDSSIKAMPPDLGTYSGFREALVISPGQAADFYAFVTTFVTGPTEYLVYIGDSTRACLPPQTFRDMHDQPSQ